MSLKRGLTYLLPLALVSALFLAACGSSPASTGPNVDFSGTITIWHNWQGSYLAAKQAIFDAYTKQHPKVKIELVHQDNVVDKTVTAVNAGSGPDIVAWVDDQLGKLAQRDRKS